ncbi:MAG: HDOD domain-containing protein [Deltaproteobacteria bacterium]|nr:HDOD domain-containing protein [Deltaproteobacteria bacterium]
MVKKLNFPRQPVASGSFVIGKRRKEILEAYLGTCVGVTLCDREAGLGGLIHLLLPEPADAGRNWHPDSYASTGLPRFIKALCDSGAEKGRLEAWVAGGALVGPLSRQDLSLDIGGRTSEIVEEILHREGIPILGTETGGYFTCRIALDLHSMETQIEPMGISPLEGPKHQLQKPTRRQLEEAIEQVRPIPQMALKIIRMLQDSKQSLADMADEIRQDQVISAKVLRLCRSALFGSKIDIDSIDRAVVLLGEKRFLQLVVSASLENFYPKNGEGYSLCKGGVYRHALGTAVLCEHLAEFTEMVRPDTAYTAGLLHDIGKVVLDQFVAAAAPLFYRRTLADGEDLVVVEKEEFGITHTETGGLLADNWTLPENVADAIKHHHQPEKAEVDERLTHLVYLADLLMSRFHVGQELDRIGTEDLVSRLGKLGIPDTRFTAMIGAIPREIFASTFLPGDPSFRYHQAAGMS